MSKLKASTSVLTVKLDTELKKEVEKILDSLGVNASQAVKMFYSQILYYKGIPFDVRIKQNFADLDDLVSKMERNKNGLDFKTDEEWISFWNDNKI